MNDKWGGLELKLARDYRDQVNKMNHKELTLECKEHKLKYKGLSDEEMKRLLKDSFYEEDMDEDEIKLLNKEKRLTDRQIDIFISKRLNGLYEKTREEYHQKDDPDLELINFMKKD
ncbi:MAG: hypothetical protein IKQ35_05850 [Bacilli bacterium]|nr:hypothetical protein [Bacilli bacterium]